MKWIKLHSIITQSPFSKHSGIYTSQQRLRASVKDKEEYGRYSRGLDRCWYWLTAGCICFLPISIGSKMIVYIVTSGKYDSYAINKVFTSHQKANDWVNNQTDDPIYGYQIEIWDVEDQ